MKKQVKITALKVLLSFTMILAGLVICSSVCSPICHGLGIGLVLVGVNWLICIKGKKELAECLLSYFENV